MQRKLITEVVVFLSLLGLAACGGGGGGGAAAPTSKVFGTAALIETDNAGGAYAPQIAIDANGNALAVWHQDDGTRYSIWSNRYTTGSGWGTAALIETDDAGSAFKPQIAFDANGNALAVWYQSDGTRFNVWSNRYTNVCTGICSIGWGTAALIETDNAGSAGNPQIAIDANGNALAVWSQDDGTNWNIWSNRYTNGSGWGTAALIETDAGSAFNPQIAIDTGGNALAVWEQSDGTRFNIWSNRYRAITGSWGNAALIETDNAGDASSPQIAFDASGNALAVWHQSDGTNYNVWSNRNTPGIQNGSGTWGTAALIETDNAGDANSPQIAFDASGNALAVWNQSDGTRTTNIWSNRYTNGSGWGTAALIETDNAGYAYDPQIAFDASGNALAVWEQWDGTRTNIWANRNTNGSGWGTAALIETDNAGGAHAPQIAFDASGNALAVWYQSDGTRDNIWSNRYQ